MTKPKIPVVLDPVLFAAGGARLAEVELKTVLLDSLIPLSTVVTPNADEIRELTADAPNNESRAAELIRRGARFVLVKGADEETPDVRNSLHDASGAVDVDDWSPLSVCMTGPAATLSDPRCRIGDFDDNGSFALDDWARFASALGNS